jgi:putative ABC transport system permease protein
VSLLRLAATNLFRNPLRTLLTVAGVSVAVLTFLLLRTVMFAWNVAADEAVADRVVTRHKVTFIMPVPKRYADDVRTAPGILDTTFASWFGGTSPNHPNEFFAALAIEKDHFFTVYDELVIPEEDIRAFREDRQGAIVGHVLAEKLGWEKGETVTLQSNIFEGDWQFHVVGLYDSTRRTFDKSSFLFRWDYLNEQVAEGFKEQVGWLVSRTDGNPAEIGRQLDVVFDERDVQTLSQDEATFQKSFLAGFAGIFTAINVVTIVILAIMSMILGNTVAMGVRERIPEYGVLRAVGFLPRHLVALVIGEAAVLGAVGGLVGLAIAVPLVQFGVGRYMEENMGAMFPYFDITPGNAVLAFVLAIGLAVLASTIPAIQASRLGVVDALRRVG